MSQDLEECPEHGGGELLAIFIIKLAELTEFRLVVKLRTARHIKHS